MDPEPQRHPDPGLKTLLHIINITVPNKSNKKPRKPMFSVYIYNASAKLRKELEI